MNTAFEKVKSNALRRLLCVLLAAVSLWRPVECAGDNKSCGWFCEDSHILNKLIATRFRSIGTNRHTSNVDSVATQHGRVSDRLLTGIFAPTRFYAGIEGGATHSKMVVLDEDGRLYGIWNYSGLNQHLEGYEQVLENVANWLRKVKKELGIAGPFAAVGMGLSGAEDDTINERMVTTLKQRHGDVANDYYLGSDSVVTLAATFEKGGTIIVAGTGSTCRLLKANGEIYGVGGWGHIIGDGGSGYWISATMIRHIFDDEDGLRPAPYPTKKAKKLMFEHFNVTSVIGMLEVFYTNFKKSKIASFATVLSTEGREDPMVRHVFDEAGELLGMHLKAVSKHFDENMFANTQVVAVGSVWNAWDLLKHGFLKGLRDYSCRIKRVSLYKLKETAAVSAAIMAARNVNRTIRHEQTFELFDEFITGTVRIDQRPRWLQAAR